jgi:hypothetical protein
MALIRRWILFLNLSMGRVVNGRFLADFAAPDIKLKEDRLMKESRVEMYFCT